MDRSSYFNPYDNTDFFGFLSQLFIRLKGFLTGNLGFADISTDELQMIVLIAVAASSALIGSFLILRKLSMLANALSHTILLGIIMAYLWTPNSLLIEGATLNIQVLLIAALLTGILTTFLTEFLNKTIRLQEDASIGIVFTTLFALGILLVTLLTRNLHIGLEAVMGNVDALHIDDAKLVGVILLGNLLITFLFFKEYKITTFDPILAKTFGISTLFFHYLLMSQVSATTIGAFRAVGVLMVLAFITGPALTARLLTNSLKNMILLAMLFGALASIIGVALSRHLLTVYGLALSTSGVVVCIIGILFVLALCIQQLRKQMTKKNIAKESFE